MPLVYYLRGDNTFYEFRYEVYLEGGVNQEDDGVRRSGKTQNTWYILHAAVSFNFAAVLHYLFVATHVSCCIPCDQAEFPADRESQRSGGRIHTAVRQKKRKKITVSSLRVIRISVRLGSTIALRLHCCCCTT